MLDILASNCGKAKRLLWDLWNAMNVAKPEDSIHLVRNAMHPNVLWRGPAPINELRGSSAVVEGFWHPLFRSIPNVSRKCSIFMAGSYDDRIWVSATGYLTGTFVRSWLGIPATQKTVHIRFGEFCAVADGQIQETIIGLDVIDVMRQAGYVVFDGYGGEAGLVPAPARGDGIMLEEQDAAESTKSIRLLDRSTARLNQYDGTNLTSVESVDYKPSDYLWFGPGGIGTTRTLADFERCHQQPFLNAFPDRRFGKYDVAIGEGGFVSCAAWPSMVATHLGNYLGAEADGKTINLRFMDWFTREGEMFTENRVWLDLIDVLQQCGVDIMARLKEVQDSNQ